MSECKRCGRYLFSGECRCQRFEVVIPWRGKVDDGQDWQSICAMDAETAAEKFAERSDCDGGDYTIIRNGEGEVWVRDSDGAVTKWDIEAEAVPTYTAREKRIIESPSPGRE